MRKCDFNKVGSQLYWNHTSVCSPVYLLDICRTQFLKTIGDCSWICNVINLVKLILKSLWCFACLNYPLLLKLFLNNWWSYLIFMYKISKWWEWIALYNYEKNYSNLFENSSDLGNNIGRLFLKNILYK